MLDNTLLADERMERVSEVNDFLLERVGNWLDEAAGLRRPEDIVVVGPDTLAPLARTGATSWNRALRKRPVLGDANAVADEEVEGSPDSGKRGQQLGRKDNIRLLTSFNVVRPQINFAEHIDNSNKPFVTKLHFKHNAMERTRREHMKIMDDYAEEGPMASSMDVDMEKPSHPYKYELDHFEPLPWQLDYPKSIQFPPPVEEMPFTHIRTEKELEDLCCALKSVREFAVDLEAHTYRSFQGLICLMQITTRTSDYIVDALALWRHMHILNDPFTDPGIVKVFHGSNMDVVWLQRDFGVYVVNMFDTGQAMRLLNFPRLSLAHLVRHYCQGEELQKQYQLADWRVRPLPDELVMYARKDTHYLLYCYDCLRQELLDQGNEQKNLLRSVYTRSRDICLTEYQKCLYKPDDYLMLLNKSRKHFNSRQEYAMKQLYAWRDHTARTEDESFPFVLPNHMLLQIAEVLPREMQGIVMDFLASSTPPPPQQQDSSSGELPCGANGRSMAKECSGEWKKGQAKQCMKEENQSANNIACAWCGNKRSCVDIGMSRLVHVHANLVDLTGIKAATKKRPGPVPPLVRRDAHSLHRIILQARALPLDKSARSPQTDKHARQFDVDPVASAFNEMRVYMKKRHDFSHSTIDEEIIPLSQRFEGAVMVVPVKDRPDLSFFDTEHDDRPVKRRKPAKSHSKSVFLDALTLYDRYLLAAAASEEQREADEDTNGEQETLKNSENQETSSRKRKMYSHLDPPAAKKQSLDEPTTSTAVSTEMEEKSNDSPVRRKKRKTETKSLAEGDQLAEMLSTKKRKKKSKPDVSLASYDYEATDSAIFSTGPSAQPAAFDPHRNYMNKRDKSKHKNKRTAKGATGTISGGLKKKSAAAFAAFDSQRSAKGRKSGKW